MIKISNGNIFGAPYDPKLLAFSFEGDEIRNPFLSPCGRFSVDPIQTYGFELAFTGGGCTALVKPLEDGTYIYLTDSSGCYAPDQNDDPEEVLIGRLDQNHEQLAISSIKDIPVAGDEELEQDLESRKISPTTKNIADDSGMEP